MQIFSVLLSVVYVVFCVFVFVFVKNNTKHKSETTTTTTTNKQTCNSKKLLGLFIRNLSYCICHLADANKPAKVNSKVTLAGDSRRTVKTIKNLCGKNYYRQDLEDAAVRRASAILRSQRATTTGVQKKRTRRKRN